jgi:hypothetical protein
MDCLSLENDNLRINVIPECGGKISSLLHKSSNVDLMWRNPRVDYRRPVLGVPVHYYDCGGWDEVLPTDLACSWRGEDYPYYGEVWALPWIFEIEKDRKDEVCAHLTVNCALSQLRVDKWITLRECDAGLEVKHRITNISSFDQEHFFWMSHVTLPCIESSRIDVPANELIVEEITRPSRLLSGSYSWPFAKDKSGEVDVRNIGSRDGTCEWFFANQLEDGWFAFSNVRNRIGVAFVFSKEVFPTVGFFINRGADRGHYSVAVEPCTGYPIRLTDAIKNGTARELGPGDSLNSVMRVYVYEGHSSVSNIRSDGTVE